MRVEVKVLGRPLKYARKVYPVGGTVSITAAESKVLTAMGRVAAKPKAQPTAAKPQKVSAPKEKSTRAFDHPGLAAPAEDAEEDKRKYLRRDMQAE